MSSNETVVAIALVHRQARWLVARRPDHVHLPGQWEFPGGKLHVDETPVDAAIRELHEECAVHAEAERTLAPVRFTYPDRIVCITPVICRWTGGEAQAIANEECVWLTLAEIEALDMPAANAAILRELREHTDSAAAD